MLVILSQFLSHCCWFFESLLKHLFPLATSHIAILLLNFQMPLMVAVQHDVLSDESNCTPHRKIVNVVKSGAGIYSKPSRKCPVFRRHHGIMEQQRAKYKAGRGGRVVSTSDCYAGSLPIESSILPQLKHACGEATGCHTGKCHTRGEPPGTYILCIPLPSVNKAAHWPWNPEEMSPEVQDRGISDPTKGLLSSNFFLKKQSTKNVVGFVQYLRKKKDKWSQLVWIPLEAIIYTFSL